jgi:hypothetical protein
VRRLLAAGLVVAAAAGVGLWVGGDQRPAPAPGLEATGAAPATPEHPSGRFVPGWLPGNLRIATEQEWAPGRTAAGWTRTYVRRGPLEHNDFVTISLEEGAPALDVDLEVSRYAGARPATVQDQPAVFLGLVAARHQMALVWSPTPGRLAQVLGSGVTEEELAGVADGFRLPPRLDATPVPDGFTEMERADDRAYPAAVPRQYAVHTLPLRGPSRPPGTRSVLVTAGWAGELPAVGTPVDVRNTTGVVTTEAEKTVLTWSERPGLVVSVTGSSVALDDVRRIASELREQSVEEIVARPAGASVVLARGESKGLPWELRTMAGPSGPCLRMVHNWVQEQCGGGPLVDVPTFESTIFQGLAFGPVALEAAAVRIELDGGRTVDTVPVARSASLASAFYVADVPPDSQLVAVVALGPDGQVLRRTPAAR